MRNLHEEKIRHFALSIVVLALALTLPRRSQGQSLYAITDLGTFGGASSTASGINDAGMIVGSAEYAGTSNPVTNHAFLCKNGVLTDLGVLGTYIYGIGTTSVSTAYCINNNSQVAGQSYTSSGALHAFLWDQGQITDLGVLPGGQQSKARAINDSGRIVGWSFFSSSQRAFLYDGGNLADLGTLGGPSSFAFGINNHGQIVGDSYTTSSSLSDTAFIYEGGNMHPLGKLNGQDAIQAFAINDNGEVAGYAGLVSTGSAATTVMHGFLYSNGTMIALGNLGGMYTNVVPNALNNRGQVVGNISGYQTAGRAFLYTDGSIRDLNSLVDPAAGWTLANATGINNNGQIVGTGRNPAFQNHGFLLTPRPSLRNLQMTAGQAQLDLFSMTGVTYRIEYAHSLPTTNWLPLTNVAPSSSPSHIVDSTGGGAAQRYYRAAQQ